MKHYVADLNPFIADRIGTERVRDDRAALVACDNIFHADGACQLVHGAVGRELGGTTGCYVYNPGRYVVEVDDALALRSTEERSAPQKSHYTVSLYFDDNCVVEIAHRLGPSAVGELEVTYMNLGYPRCRRA